MQNLEIPAKLIRLTEMTMKKSHARLLTIKEITDEISIQTGVRQGDALSTTLFNIVLEAAIDATGIRGTIAQK